MMAIRWRDASWQEEASLSRQELQKEDDGA